MNTIKTGFTLIELIVAIVILGILTAVAAPRFLNLQQSVKVATLDGIAGAIRGVIIQAKAKALIQGLTVATENPSSGNVLQQPEYVIDFGIGTVEVDWSTLCPESLGESGDAMTMLDFLTLDTSGSLTTALGNRHTVTGYKHDFSKDELGVIFFMTPLVAV